MSNAQLDRLDAIAAKPATTRRDMSAALPLPLDTPAIDVSRLVQWIPSSFGTRYRVGSGDKRAGQVGTVLGTIALKHAPGYEVVLKMDNGRIESFAPMSLFPECEEPTTEVPAC